MIKKLFDVGCFDYKKFIIDYAKDLSLNSLECHILILVIEEYINNKNLNVENIYNKILANRKDFELALTKLVDRNFYSVYVKESNGKLEESISIDGFFNHVENVLTDNKNKDLSDELRLTIEYLKSKINRILTPSELEIISKMINEESYKLNDFKNVCENILNSDNITFRSIVRNINVEKKTKKADVPDFYKEFIKSVK